MITLAVLAILTSLALPSYRDIIEKRQVTSGAEQFAAFFSTVKSHAVKRNQHIAMYPAVNAGEWCMGFKEFDRTQTFDQQKCDCWQTNIAAADACSVDLNNDGSWQDNELTVLMSADLRKPETLNSIEFRQGETPIGNNKFFVFDSIRGFLDVQPGYADNMIMDFSAGQYALQVTIDRLGRTFICSPQSDDHIPVPGYDQC